MGPTAVVLAAGAGTRFDGPTHKLLARLADGRTVVEHAVAAAVAADIGPVLVVAGAVELPPLPAGVAVLANRRWADGIATSLAVAVEAAEATVSGHDAVVVGLGDQPAVAPDAWRLVAGAVTTPIAVATYEGRRGNPVRLAAEVWPELPTTGDEGARVLLHRRPELVTEVPCPGSGADIDTLEDLRRWS